MTWSPTWWWLLSSSSDDDSDYEIILAMLAEREQYELMNAARQRQRRRRRNSVTGRQVIHPNREASHFRLYQDFFSEAPTYGPTIFRRRFRMARSLFFRIAQAVEDHDDYFEQRSDTAGHLELSSLHKITAAFQMLTDGVPADATDVYVRVEENIATESFKRFVKAIVQIFGDEYLRSPNANDTTRLLAIGEERGFPGMLGSIDCMHWKWKNSPTLLPDMHTGHVHEPNIILEAIASQDLWIWHASFHLPVAHSDINLLHRSLLFAKLAKELTPEVNYTINGHKYTMGYYLAGDIYPTCASFVKTIPSPQGNKEKHFARAQEIVRKDVERAFVVLQSRFAIVRGPTQIWDQDMLEQIMTACVIMHNMIIEDERDGGLEDFHYEGVGENVVVSHDHVPELLELIQTDHSSRNQEAPSQFQDVLVEHLFQHHQGV